MNYNLLIFSGISDLAWAHVYILIIIKSFQDKCCGMPLFCASL